MCRYAWQVTQNSRQAERQMNGKDDSSIHTTDFVCRWKINVYNVHVYIHHDHVYCNFDFSFFYSHARNGMHAVVTFYVTYLTQRVNMDQK